MQRHAWRAGLTGENAASDFCTQLRGHPMNEVYDLAEFLMTCEQTFVRTIGTERSISLMSDSRFYSEFSSLLVHLSDKRVPLERLQTSMGRQPPKTNMLVKLLQSQAGSSSSFCEVGFGEGAATMLALQNLPNSKVFSFDGNEVPMTVPVHDFLDER
jgi:hypothetical protein